jgi:hypothetical protein
MVRATHASLYEIPASIRSSSVHAELGRAPHAAGVRHPIADSGRACNSRLLDWGECARAGVVRERHSARIYTRETMSARQIATRQITLSSNAAGVRTRGDSEFTTYLTPAITLDPNVSWGARAVSGTLWYSAPNLVLGASSRFGYIHLGVDYVVDLSTGTRTRCTTSSWPSTTRW